MTSCNTTKIKYEPIYYKIEIPEYVRTCEDLPKKPTWPYDSKAVATFVKKLDNARKDCKLKLQTAVTIVDKNNELLDKAAKEVKK